MQAVLIIALVLFCILMLPVKIILSSDDGFSATLRILFFNFSIPPKSKEKKKMSRRDFRNELKKQRLKSKGKAKIKKDKKSVKKYSGDDIPFYLELLKGFIGKTYESAKRGLTVKVEKLHITVATDDPAKTAISYGIISQACAYLFEFLGSLVNIKYKKNSNVAITTDFSSTETTYEMKIALSWRLYRALAILASTALRASNSLSSHREHLNKKSQKQKNTTQTTEEK